MRFGLEGGAYLQTDIRSEDLISSFAGFMIKEEEFGFVNDFIVWFRRAKNGLVLKERLIKFL